MSEEQFKIQLESLKLLFNFRGTDEEFLKAVRKEEEDTKQGQ